MTADLRGSEVARRLTQASPVARSNRTAELARLIAGDRPVRNAGLAVEAADDFPEAIPVTARELEVIETYLNAALDQSDTTDEPQSIEATKSGKALGRSPDGCENDCSLQDLKP